MAQVGPAGIELSAKQYINPALAKVSVRAATPHDMLRLILIGLCFCTMLTRQAHFHSSRKGCLSSRARFAVSQAGWLVEP